MAEIPSSSTSMKESSFDLPKESQNVIPTIPSLEVPNAPNEPI